MWKRRRTNKFMTACVIKTRYCFNSRLHLINSQAWKKKTKEVQTMKSAVYGSKLSTFKALQSDFSFLLLATRGQNSKLGEPAQLDATYITFCNRQTQMFELPLYHLHVCPMICGTYWCLRIHSFYPSGAKGHLKWSFYIKFSFLMCLNDYGSVLYLRFLSRGFVSL